MSVSTKLKAATPTPKVAAQTTVGLITGLITWLLVTTYWKSGLPIQVAVALPGLVTFGMGFVGGWLKKENITVPPLDLVERAGPTTSMYDSTNPAAIPASAPLVAAYVDGYGGYSAAVARFGASKVISISVGNNNADVADVESGAMTAGDLPGWIARQVARGVKRPVVYCNESTWPSVKAAVGNLSVSYWIANPGGSGVIAGADAVQNVWEGSWDSSVVQSTFPFYNGSVTPPPTPPASVWPLVLGDTGANVTTVQTDLNKWATPIKLKTKLVVDGNFGALTEAAVKLALTYFDYSAANVALGQVPESLATHLAGAVPAPPPPPAPKYYGAPRSATAKAIVPATANYTLEWAAPAAVAGVPAPTEYELFVYNGEANEAHIVAGYPLTVVGTSHELANLTAGDHYIVHIVAAGDSVFIGPDVFATVDVSPPLA